MGHVPPPPPPPAPRIVVDGPTFGLQVTKPGVSVGRVIMRGLGFGDQIAKLVPQEVGMIVTDAPGKPRTPGKSRTPGSLKCTYCGCVHRLSDLKSTANCPNCSGNNMVRVGDHTSSDLRALLDRRKDYLRQMAKTLGLSPRRRRDYVGTESSGPL